MYNPSRGGVRGGADQFTWESVKNDKHRENYLGHSLMAPVGRWQKGKDLSWYAKGRNETSSSDRSELASIKRAEEEAMLIALGHNIVRKTQTLSKEDIREALKRNTGDRDELNTDRIDGVGASSQRVAALSGISKDSRQTNEGVAFECRRERNSETANENVKRDRDHSTTDDRKKNKKKSKKLKKEKKHKKHHKESYDSDSSNDAAKPKMKHSGKNGSDSECKMSSKQKSHKMSKHRHREYSPDRSHEKSYADSRKQSHKRHKKQSDCDKRRRHDTSESD